MRESNRQRRLIGQSSRGKEIFEITPVILGGSPTDPANKALLSREEHIRAVAYWNRIVMELREKSREANQRTGGPGRDGTVS
jgi:hypothetical protein